MDHSNRVTRRRLYQQVADDLERLIVEGRYRPGMRLPSEHRLAQQYDVSRNVIREALKRLKEHGLVQIKTGSGTYVNEPSTKPVSDALHRLLRLNSVGYSFNDLYEIRQMLEPESARLAAERSEDEDITRIEQALQRMRDSQDDSEAWSEADLDFHLCVATATKNPLLRSILDPLSKPLHRVIAAGYLDPEGTRSGLEAHERVLDAIRQHNPENAYQAMLAHLLDSRQRLSKLELRIGAQGLEELD